MAFSVKAKNMSRVAQHTTISEFWPKKHLNTTQKVMYYGRGTKGNSLLSDEEVLHHGGEDVLYVCPTDMRLIRDRRFAALQ
jgi:hypothetical protein